MEIYITLPTSVEDLDVLIWRLEKFKGITVCLEADRIKLIGTAEKLLNAQNYALRFIGPESMQLLHLSPQCLSMFHVSGVIKHFENTFDVIICLKQPQGVALKGRKLDNVYLQTVLEQLDVQCGIRLNALSPFKLSNLRVLCHKFEVAFDEIPGEPSVQMALLTYFSSLLSEIGGKTESTTQSPPYMEVYRKQAAEPLLTYKKFVINEGATYSTRGLVAPAAVRKELNYIRSADRENVCPAESDSISSRLRTVVIDGSNVAFAHGKQKEFSPQGIQLALDFFLKRGHTNVVTVVPRHRQSKGGALFDRLERAGRLCYSPSRLVNDTRQVADDDRIILQFAVEWDAVVVSNDQFRNYREESEQFKDVIDHRLLQYTLALDTFLVAEDPYGSKGPSLSECLRISSSLRK